MDSAPPLVAGSSGGPAGISRGAHDASASTRRRRAAGKKIAFGLVAVKRTELASGAENPRRESGQLATAAAQSLLCGLLDRTAELTG